MPSKIETKQDLQQTIRSLVVKDYGDFKRKILLYIARYKELHRPNQQQNKIYSELVDRIQFHPNQDIESTRNWVVTKLSSL